MDTGESYARYWVERELRWLLRRLPLVTEKSSTSYWELRWLLGEPPLVTGESYAGYQLDFYRIVVKLLMDTGECYARYRVERELRWLVGRLPLITERTSTGYW